MNFCVCRNCNHCRYNGYRDTNPYCDLTKEIHCQDIKVCPMGRINRDEFGNEE